MQKRSIAPLAAFVLVGCLFSAFSSPASAQRQQSAPAAENKTLVTKDGVSVAISYFPSRSGQQATPVVVLHDLKESRAIYRDLATRLQQPGQGDDHPSFAVVTVDLRGHGDSMTQALPGGQTRQIEAAKLKKNDAVAMVLGDMEAVRKFLVGENDAKKLNLNRLSVIGVGLGAAVGGELGRQRLEHAAARLAQAGPRRQDDDHDLAALETERAEFPGPTQAGRRPKPGLDDAALWG